MRRSMALKAAFAAALVTSGLVVAYAAPATSAAPPVRPAVELEGLSVQTTQVASGLTRPTAVAAPADGSGRLFITEKAGRVRVYHPSTGLAATPLLDITSRVSNSGNERGLLGIAPSPRFATDGDVYLAYTRVGDNAVTLARYDTGSGAVTEVLTQEHATYSNHNGGQLAFDAAGLLYWGIGDGGSSGDPFDSSQRLDTLLGKILRLDVSCATYCVPADNPFVGTAGARGEIYAYGLRNPWRFSFDPADGSLWIADVGQGTLEEVDHLRANQKGANLGWSCKEGTATFNQARCRPGVALVDPVFTYQTSVEGCAVIGGHVYRGRQYADIAAGVYVATDYCTSPAFAIRANADGTHTNARIGEFPIQVTSFGTDAEGELYVVNDLPGQLHKVGFRQENPPTTTTTTPPTTTTTTTTTPNQPAGTCRVAYRVLSQWGGGFTAEVTVTNTGRTAVAGWAVRWSFAGDQRVTNHWNAAITQQSRAVTAANVDWNRTLAPGASATFGFQGAHTGTNQNPVGFTLNNAPCT